MSKLNNYMSNRELDKRDPSQHSRRDASKPPLSKRGPSQSQSQSQTSLTPAKRAGSVVKLRASLLTQKQQGVSESIEEAADGDYPATVSRQDDAALPG